MWKIDFQDSSCGGHLGLSIGSVLAFLCLLGAPWCSSSSFNSNGSLEEMSKVWILNIFPTWMFRTHTNVCGSKFDLTVKRPNVNVFHQFSNFLDLPSLIFCAKISPQGLLGSGETIFTGFYHIWLWLPFWSTDRDHFTKQEGSTWNLISIGPVSSEKKSFEILNIFLIQTYGVHTNP